MPRINLDIDFLTHPKTLSISPLAQLLFIRSIIYAAKHLTDGFVPAGAVAYLSHDLLDTTASPFAHAGELVAELESVGWWVKATGGHTIHDYLDYQLSRKDVEIYKENKRIAGRFGGLAKSKQTSSRPPSKTVAKPTPIPIPIPIPNPKNQSHSDKSSREVATLPRVGKGVMTWEHYQDSYRRRYGTDPVRNQTVNSQLARLVDRLGAEDAPQVAAFFLSHNDPFYVRKRHPVGLLLQDAESLRTQWATGIKSTTSEAKNAEVKDNIVSQADRVIANMQRKGTL